jgi:hypothetical protein
MSTTTLDTAREKKRVRASLALLMALDSLDVAQGRIRALSVKAQRGIYSEALHLEAVGNLHRALEELGRAHVETAAMPDEQDMGGVA